MITLADIGRNIGLVEPAERAPAPGPYEWDQRVDPTKTNFGHLYVTDRTGRKIGVVWGRQEKVATLGLFLASWDMQRALIDARAFIERLPDLPGAMGHERAGTLAKIARALDRCRERPQTGREGP
jgi:hypothetical protein